MSVNTTLQVVLALLPFLVALAGILYQVALSRLPVNQRAHVEKTVGLLVRAAEQTYKNVPGSGAYKKAQVLQLLGGLGVKADPKLIDALIEAAVASLSHSA